MRRVPLSAMAEPFFMNPGAAQSEPAAPETHAEHCCQQPGDLDAHRRAEIHFPCEFMIKAMGLQSADFKAHVHAIIAAHAPDLKLDDLSVRASGKGKYASVSATIKAQSREQLDAIYMALKSDPQILYML